MASNFLRPLRFRSLVKSCPRRSLSTPPPSSSQPARDSYSRLRRFNERLPSFLRPYTAPLLGAPVTHITSFLILHEITAVVPLFGLVGAFHYAGWTPDSSSWIGEGGAFDEGVKSFGRWLRKKGWVEESDVDVLAGTGNTASSGPEQPELRGAETKGVRLLLEFATAYAITKALLPVRIAASVWATPWFARTVVGPVGSLAKKVFVRR
ncbi:hypothetical protein DTO212C5_8151 [Paecilomyces variotii]|nr:hypothetical protein DTO212C5_8151 [Paecilomyces variotii]